MAYSPTVRRRRLSNALLQYRQETGLDAKEVAKRLGWPASKLTRIERNEWKLPSVGDVMDLLDCYEIHDEARRQALITLARESRKRGWWEEQYKDILGGALVGLEWEASQIQTFEALVVPGLLQSADYAAAVLRGGQVLGEEDIQRQVAARLARQRSLDREDAPNFWAVIDEAALRKQVGGVAVMRHQLHHLRQMAERPNVGIQVLPDSVGAHTSMTGPFTILDYQAAEDPSIVYVEVGAVGDLFLEKPADLAHYRRKYGYLQASALSADASRGYLEDLVKQLE
ncbi:helix-turn-helix transcriptional regulator [Sphaerisporangium sp. NPDC088356]|uniref:helix-turn-helix domain-containing protein n=1 Tax=Sphaerisporangium sp. NPDC088356 TaxID=3154871 RepID=UPI00342241AA